jgi:threonyl-tRNA synthetase
MWKLATAALEGALKHEDREFAIDPGEGVFYGPKIDVKIKDAIGRSWQCSTIQVDFNLPERFSLEYIAKDGSAKTPIMIHRALFGSLERFMGVLIEHYAGAFPVWIAPVQVAIIPVSEKSAEYALAVHKSLAEKSLRSFVDSRNEKMQKKIRDAEVDKVPYMLIVGEKEALAKTVSVRSKSKGDLGAMGLDKFIDAVKEEIAR